MFCLEVWKEIPAHNFRVLQVVLFRGPQPPTEKYLQVKNSSAKSSGPNLLRGQRFQKFETTKKPTKKDPKCFIHLLELSLSGTKIPHSILFRFNFHPSKDLRCGFFLSKLLLSKPFTITSPSEGRLHFGRSPYHFLREMLKVCGRRSFPRNRGRPWVL